MSQGDGFNFRPSRKAFLKRFVFYFCGCFCFWSQKWCQKPPHHSDCATNWFQMCIIDLIFGLQWRLKFEVFLCFILFFVQTSFGSCAIFSWRRLGAEVLHVGLGGCISVWVSSPFACSAMAPQDRHLNQAICVSACCAEALLDAVWVCRLRDVSQAMCRCHFCWTSWVQWCQNTKPMFRGLGAACASSCLALPSEKSKCCAQW